MFGSISSKQPVWKGRPGSWSIGGLSCFISSLLGRLEAIATRVEATATRVEAIATRVEAIATTRGGGHRY